MRRALAFVVAVGAVIAACAHAEPERPRPDSPAPAASMTAPSRSASSTGSEAPAPPSSAVLAERAFHPNSDDDLFTKKLPPRPGDWLARFHERGQSFVRYRGSDPIRPTGERNKLVMQPLGTFTPTDTALL